MKRIYTLILLLSAMVVNTFAQGNVGIGTNNPVNSAALDITASDKGLLIPRVSLSSAITFGLTGTATAGMLVFNTNGSMLGGMGVGFYYWNGALWAKIIENTSVTLTNGTILIGNASNIPVERTISGDATVTNTGVLTIANDAITTAKIANNAVDGTKINLTGNANGDLMYYNGTDWVRLASGTTGQILQTNGAAAPTWVSKTAILNSQNGLSTVTSGGSATATTPYVELGGALYKATNISGIDATNKLTFTATGTDAINFDNNTLSIDATNDRVGIGTTAPASTLSVGSSNQFQVNSTGNIVKLNNVPTNFPATQGAANSILTNDGSGILSWSISIIKGGSQIFFYTGSDQYFKVPMNVTKISVKLWGGGGAGSAFNNQACGGSAGFVSGDLAVTPGDMLRIVVGYGGFSDGQNAYGGGGKGVNGQSGGGGGRSAIRLKNGTADLVTAGGGGGAADDDGGSKIAYGGAGGGTTGGNGGVSNATYPNAAGKGGTQIAGGAGGGIYTGHNGSNGTAYQGGNGNSRDWEGGGGGGGYYGGGGGAGYYGGGGGGGSSYVGGLTGTVTNAQGASGTDGFEKAPGGSSDADYISGIGTGGKTGIGGGPGLVIIYW